LYPISAKEAAAAEPANPDPTTITSKFLLFAGLTNGTEDLYLVHFCDNSPSGILESSISLFLFWYKMKI
jgi:hypothetical protein